MVKISGWIPYWLDPMIYVRMFLLGFGTYLVVACLEYKKIQRISMKSVLSGQRSAYLLFSLCQLVFAMKIYSQRGNKNGSA